MKEVIFLLVLAGAYLVFASIQDLKKREVANWLNFSLIIFALAYRLFYSVFTEDFNFLIQGLIGLGIFFIVGNLLYYARMFAGGDAKLMIALGPLLGFSSSIFINLKIFAFFLILFLISGGIYGLTISFVLSLKNSRNFKKEFFSRLKENKRKIYFVMVIGLFVMALGFLYDVFLILGALIFIFPYFYVYAKAVDEASMVRKIKADDLREGDWLYEDVKVGKNKICANWAGLNKKDIKLFKKSKREVLIRQGIAFVPVFLISFLFLCLFYFFEWGLWMRFF